ncbi:unnamed protein product [Polarella glacialis]|uniref:Core Histone H2A/H2B/H3 domain-containing protein n=2 Tax=Polarella glacialis TaxID=89957 RepID=A0A813KET0_POLGL|nr:unnamed protein product [Polarella glacialis]
MVRARPVPKRRSQGDGGVAAAVAAAGAVPVASAAAGAGGVGAAAPSRASHGVRRDSPLEREIRKLQADHHYLSIPKIAFARMVKELQSRFIEEPFRWSSEALMLLQFAAEEYLMYLYADAYLATVHRHRVTLNTEDLRLVRRLRQPHCWGETS